MVKGLVACTAILHWLNVGFAGGVKARKTVACLWDDDACQGLLLRQAQAGASRIPMCAPRAVSAAVRKHATACGFVQGPCGSSPASPGEGRKRGRQRRREWRKWMTCALLMILWVISEAHCCVGRMRVRRELHHLMALRLGVSDAPRHYLIAFGCAERTCARRPRDGRRQGCDACTVVQSRRFFPAASRPRNFAGACHIQAPDWSSDSCSAAVATTHERGRCNHSLMYHLAPSDSFAHAIAGLGTRPRTPC